MGILMARNLVKKFQTGEIEVDALKSIDLDISEGEFVAIMGPSGSGKSTLLYLLGGLDYPTSGEVLLDGQDISTMDDMEISKVRRSEIGFIFQFYNLVPVLNVRENILMPIMLDHKKEEAYEEKLSELLDIVGLKERQYHKPSQLSGGQQQRVAVARALINNPKVILADEPTGNLDTKASEEILEILQNLSSKHGKTIVMVTHNPVLAEYADRIIQIVDGHVKSDVKK